MEIVWPYGPQSTDYSMPMEHAAPQDSSVIGQWTAWRDLPGSPGEQLRLDLYLEPDGTGWLSVNQFTNGKQGVSWCSALPMAYQAQDGYLTFTQYSAYGGYQALCLHATQCIDCENGHPYVMEGRALSVQIQAAYDEWYNGDEANYTLRFAPRTVDDAINADSEAGQTWIAGDFIYRLGPQREATITGFSSFIQYDMDGMSEVGPPVVDVVIPEQLSGVPVKTVEGWGLSLMAGVRTVHIPEGVQTIGDRTLAYLPNLEEVWLPGSLAYIGVEAFMGDNTLLVHVPSNSYAHAWAMQVQQVTVDAIAAGMVHAVAGQMQAETSPASEASAADQPRYQTVTPPAMGVRGNETPAVTAPQVTPDMSPVTELESPSPASPEGLWEGILKVGVRTLSMQLWVRAGASSHIRLSEDDGVSMSIQHIDSSVLAEWQEDQLRLITYQGEYVTPQRLQMCGDNLTQAQIPYWCSGQELRLNLGEAGIMRLVPPSAGRRDGILQALTARADGEWSYLGGNYDMRSGLKVLSSWTFLARKKSQYIPLFVDPALYDVKSVSIEIPLEASEWLSCPVQEGTGRQYDSQTDELQAGGGKTGAFRLEVRKTILDYPGRP